VSISLRAWLNPARPEFPEVVVDPRERTAIKLELLVVLLVTLGLSGLNSLLSYLDGLLQRAALADQQVALNRPLADIELIDLLQQLLSVLRLLAWAGLAAFLLWRSGIALARIGFGWWPRAREWLGGLGLAALIGIPGLLLFLLAWQLGVNRAVLPSTLDDTWWRPIVLTLAAIGNSLAEELIVVGLLLTRLRQLGVSENAGLLASAVLRGSYHFYQGLGGFVGNLVMGLIFGRVWQRTNQLWPLVIAHALLDIVAFVGYSLLRGQVSWLP
jgi:membrane protease YdiL (CAAX protease family)